MNGSRFFGGCFLAVSLLAAPLSVQAAPEAYMKVTGQKSGQITGGVTLKGREGAMAVVAVSHSIVSPRDPQSGLPTGRRMHKPFVVTIEWDKAMPLLYNALAANENLPKVEIDFWGSDVNPATGVGADVHDFTVTLTNANIASIDMHMPDTRVPDERNLPRTLEVAFTYQKIEWNFVNGNVSAADDWINRTAAVPSAHPKVFVVRAKAPATRSVWRAAAPRRKHSALVASTAGLGSR